MSFFHFLKFVMYFLKGVVSICHSFRSTGQPGLILFYIHSDIQYFDSSHKLLIGI